MDSEFMETTEEAPFFSKDHHNRKGTLRHNPYATFLKKGGSLTVDDSGLERSLNKQGRWKTLDAFNSQVESGNTSIHVETGPRTKRPYRYSNRPESVNHILLSVHGGEAAATKETPPPAFKIIQTRKGPVKKQLRSPGKKVVGKFEGLRAKKAAMAAVAAAAAESQPTEPTDEPDNASEDLVIAVTPCMPVGHYPLLDDNGRTTRPWNKHGTSPYASYGVRERNRKKKDARKIPSDE